MPLLWKEGRQAVQEWLSSSAKHGRLSLHSKHEGLSLCQKYWKLCLPQKSLPILPEEDRLLHWWHGILLLWVVFCHYPHIYLFNSIFLKKVGQPRPLLCLFSFFSNTNFTEKTVGFSGIQTWIIGVEGKPTDQLNTTTALFNSI